MNPKDLITDFDRLAHDPIGIYRVCKIIDSYPEVEGTWLPMGARVLKFANIRERMTFYEPLSTYDHLQTAVFMNALLAEGYTPRWAWNRPVISFQMFQSIYDAPEGKVPIPKVGEAAKGVHAVAVDGGYSNSGETLRFMNSWGVGWGDKGYGSLSRKYLERYLVDAWLGRNVRVGLSRFTFRQLVRATNAKEFARVWMVQNPRERARFRIYGRSYRLHLYETLSILGSPVEIIELRTGQGIRLGWAHLHHVGEYQPRTSILKELFVWPPFRRRGYGAILEGLACQRATQWRSSRIVLYFHDADALPRNRAAGRLFGKQAGYKWDWRRKRLPNLAAVGEKSL
jgi:GNAT superfamily N-acetyltransferase